MYRVISYSFCLLVAALVLFAFSPRGAEEENSEPLNLGRVQINDLVAVNGRLIAVGERGTIVVSEDNGQNWQVTHRDGEIPVTLTDITALTDQVLLAVGHDSVILRSEDAGLSWELIERDSELGEPLLGSWSADGQNVYVYGSFGKFWLSADAGRTFEPQELPIYGEHLSAMAGDEDKTRIIVGEMGLVLRSFDGGDAWEKLDPFYNGSLFGVAHLHGTRWVAYGMRGHVFFSGDDGDSWTQVNVGGELPLYGHAVASSGKQMLIVGTAGFLVIMNDEGELLETGSIGGLGTLTSAVILPDGEIFVAGQRGLMQRSHNLVAAWAK
ncbi:WD40/YVTN/BNR-like repeat-containing protein [Marinobacter sp. X15-166B]|uniref:WD40/YVTN/BNR-like repeat-containing protein n=1 Tax=Marinobacter sp. X15-166B TaxID=1897620 RepID=UPI00085CBE63|nr:glycosyl hydrolase [Marinobacter sp. X15-166B]OEY66329.1 glycosyl hydrolase [Marinobacter sp. X15-166B]